MKRVRYERNDNVILRSVAGASLLITLDGSRDTVYTLNSTGTLLWEWIATPCTGNELVFKLTNEFPELEQEEAMADVEGFLKEMTGLSLLLCH